ncbi:histone acetyltransferase subunit NuA4-domain-containing protein [Bombardia bombarda]|uniref:Chromatin modification-related protein EAF6 n=1 Tax=Bombardia bombarda TaxID=252184 RepID=A0AA40BYU5_9PEZI|nr:histone acetyltransferase subunit NuA4-domain-containing protein [Bombardia bombarda]
MTENAPSKSGGVGDGSAGIPFYEKQRTHLKELISRKRALEKRIATQEESIYTKETEYLETTPSGNIITGFDNYIKGTTNAASQRRKTGLTDANRVFSRSSISYNPSAQQDAQTPASTTASTPASHAPTPISTSFKDKDGGASGAPTPTSATASKAPLKKSKKATAATAAAAVAAAAAAVAASAAGIDDSETDSRESKKVRTNFGAVRR